MYIFRLPLTAADKYYQNLAKIVLLSPINSSKIFAKSGKHLVPKSAQKTNKMEYNISRNHGLGDTTQSHKAKPNGY